MPQLPVQIGNSHGTNIGNTEQNFTELFTGAVSTPTPFSYGNWVYAENIGSPPAAQFSFNNTNISQATEMYIADLDNLGLDKSALMQGFILPGTRFRLQQYDSASAYIDGRVTEVTDSSGFTTFAVTEIEGVGTITVGQQFIFVAGATTDAASLRVERVSTVEFFQAPPIVPSTFGTGVDPAAFDSTVELAVVFVYESDSSGNQYALFKQVRATTLVASPQIRITDSSEPETAGGDASMYFWYDDGPDNEIKVQLDFDGGGKTPILVQVVSAYDRIINNTGTVQGQGN